MKSCKRLPSARVHVCLFALIVGAMALFTPVAQAANDIWTGGTANWSTGAWTGGNNPPQNNDTVSITCTPVNACTVTITNSYTTPGLASLILSNTTLIVTQSSPGINTSLIINGEGGTNTFQMANGGRLEIDYGGSVTMTNAAHPFYWFDANGVMILNNGGTFYANNGAFDSYDGVYNYQTNLVTSTASTGGIWNNQNASFYIGKSVTGHKLIFANGVIATNFSTSFNVGGGGSPSAVGNSFWVTNGASMSLGAVALDIGCNAGALNNYVVINSATVTCNQIIIGSAGTAPNNPGLGTNNFLIVTNGGSALSWNSTGVYPEDFVAGFGNYAIVAGANANGKASFWDMGGARGGLYLGGGNGTGCWVCVAAGGVITNFNARACIGPGAGANYNSLIVTNGGQVFGDPNLGALALSPFAIGGWVMPTNSLGISTNGGGIGNSLIISGSGSVFDFSGSNTNSAALASILLPCAFGTNGSLVINNGGLLKMKANSAAVLQVGGQLSSTSNAVSNVVSIASGGTLEAMGLTATNAANGNVITNTGGIYQFPANNPLLISSGSGAGIYLNKGTIAFRAINNADVYCNQSGKPLDSANNMTFLDNNAFRLNWATNQNYSSQTYTFDPAYGPTNFYRLEMVNGSTCYRGTNGNVLTIGAGVGSGGQMLCSNTSAQVNLIFTNNGTVTIENSTLTFTNSAVMNGTIVIDLNNLTAAEANGTMSVIQASNLTLNGSSALVLTGTGSTNLTIMSGTLNGKFGSVTTPLRTGIYYSSGKITLAPAAAGSAILVF